VTRTDRSPVTVEAMLDLRTMSDVQLSPDGSLAVIVIGQAFSERDRPSPSSIWAVSIDDGTIRSYTPDGTADRMPRWSPDATILAVLSDRAHRDAGGVPVAGAQVYLMPRDGSEARRLTSVHGVIHDMAWTPDGSQLILLMTEPESEQHRGEDDVIEVEQHPLFWRLWSVTLADGAVTALTPPGLQVWEFGLAPDGATAALIVSDAPFEWSWYQARLAVLALGTPDVRTFSTTPRQLAHPRVSYDGTTASVISCTWSDRGVIGGDVLLVPLHGGAARNLTAGQPLSVSWSEWEPSGATLLCCGYTDGEIALWRLRSAGDITLLWRDEGTFIEHFQPRFSRGGSLVAALREDTAHPVDLWVARLEAEAVDSWRQVTRLHHGVEDWALGPVRTVRWAASDATPIQGLLALPDAYREGTHIPLVTLVHGGPAFLQPHAFCLDIVRWARLLAAHGCAVLLPNPRGSTGWGTAFTEANLGDMGGADWGDIMAGVDHVIDIGVADAERLGIGGFSYGGFMAAWAVTQTDRFKAAVMFAGIADWQSFHGVGPVPTWDALA
jgi:dipeptidyl aminopeptidase/acylaminoacyl peptidase